MKVEEILTDELSEDHVYILNTTPKLKEWIIDAMKLYANHKLDTAAELAVEMSYERNKDHKEEGLVLRDFQVCYATPKQTILSLKDKV